MQIMFALIFNKISWFSDNLYVQSFQDVPSCYNFIISYLKKEGVLDSVVKRKVQHPGYSSFLIRKDIFIGGEIKTLYANGVAENEEVALSKALGEILERVLSGIGDKNKGIVKASPLDVKEQKEIIYPPKYHRYLDIQKERHPFLQHDPSSSLEWVSGLNLVSKKETLIPKIMTSWFHRYLKQDNVFISSTTNGCAGYFTKEGSILRGLLEVVQRDAFLVHWLTGIAPKRIALNGLPIFIVKKIELFSQRGLSIFLLDTTTDIGIPSVCAIALWKDKWRGVAVSSSSDLSYFKAIDQALDEMVVCATSLFLEEKPSEMFPEPFVSELNKKTREVFWRHPKNLQEIEWFLGCKEVSLLSSVTDTSTAEERDEKKDLEDCLSLLKKMGPDYFPVAYFPKNKLQKKLNYYISQVFIPKAFPLYLVEYMGTFESDRLKEFAAYKQRSSWKMTETPHMFT